METFISIERLFVFIILININLQSLIHGYVLKSTEVPSFKPSHLNVNSKPHLTFEINNNKHFADHKDKFAAANFIHSEKKINNIKQKDFQLGKLNYHTRLYEKNNPTNAATVTSVDTPFMPKLPEYSQNSMKYRFPKFINNKATALSNFHPSTNEHDIDNEETTSRLLNWKHGMGDQLTFESKPKLISQPTISSPKYAMTKEYENTKDKAESSNNSSKTTVPKLLQPQEVGKPVSRQNNYEHSSEPSETKKLTIVDAQENDKHYVQATDEDMKESPKFSAMHDIESKLIDAPWSLYKDEAFPVIKPFPEFYDSDRSQRKHPSEILQTYPFKKAFPLNEEESVKEIAGPVLYPKASFGKEFHVPFFVK